METGRWISSGQKAPSLCSIGGTIPSFSNRYSEGKWFFQLGAMLPTMSAHLGVEGLEAIGLVGTARSSPQPPLAVARRARLEVVVPTRQHWAKRFVEFCLRGD
jgi:hypothetical protein